MAKNDDKSFRIVIDKRIVRAFNEIPEPFNIKQLTEVTKIPPEDKKSVYDVLERMVKYGLIHKSKSDKCSWYKDHDFRNKDGFERWILDYYKQIKDKKDD